MSNPPTLMQHLRASLVPSGTADVVPIGFISHGRAYYPTAFVGRLLHEMQIKTMLAKAGMDELTALELLAIHILIDSAPEYKPEETESES